ncbi:MAG: SDR family oxidoreductase [Chloroflexi bacterium]|nr:SDR family oxidoreductase [Chloroflexota bacterium]
MNIYSSKLSLITGGSSGIGLSLAKKILQLEGNVVILARRKELLDKALADLRNYRKRDNQNIFSIQADVTQQTDISEKLESFVSLQGLPDFIFNSAGVAHPGNFTSLKHDIFHWMMDVNYFGTVNVLKTLVPLMQKRRSGSIINISSIAGFIGVYGYTAYGASKFAVSGFTDALRAELHPYGISLSIVFPPDTNTPQLEYERKYKPFITKEIAGSANLLTSDAVAEEILKQVARKKYLILPGSEGKLLYFGKNLLGGTLYPVMDMMVRSAIKKIKFHS